MASQAHYPNILRNTDAPFFQRTHSPQSLNVYSSHDRIQAASLVKQLEGALITIFKAVAGLRGSGCDLREIVLRNSLFIPLIAPTVRNGNGWVLGSTECLMSLNTERNGNCSLLTNSAIRIVTAIVARVASERQLCKGRRERREVVMPWLLPCRDYAAVIRPFI